MSVCFMFANDLRFKIYDLFSINSLLKVVSNKHNNSKELVLRSFVKTIGLSFVNVFKYKNEINIYFECKKFEVFTQQRINYF